MKPEDAELSKKWTSQGRKKNLVLKIESVISIVSCSCAALVLGALSINMFSFLESVTCA